MPISVVIELEALRPAVIDQFTGRGVHGFWFQHWARVNPALADQLHGETQETPFTLSPLMGLPAPRQGKVTLKAGAPAWLRLTALTDALAEAVQAAWLPALPPGFQLSIPANADGVRWKITGHTLASAPDPGLERAEDYLEMARRHLTNANPSQAWQLEFLTPTTFHGKNSHLPFPLPDSLVGSWLRRWQAFAPLALPAEELLDWTRRCLAVSAYRLHTLPAREGNRLRVGCVGRLTLRAIEKTPYLCACLDLLAEYAFYCGSGSHTSQGLGQTRRLPAT